MSRISGAIHEMQTIEESASRDQWVNRLHPLVKFLVTLFYLVCVVSCGRYDLPRVLGLALYPFVLFELTDLPLGQALCRLRLVLPLVCIVGIFNPLLDRRPGAELLGFTLTLGLLSMLTLMAKGILTVLASYLLVAPTPGEGLCAAWVSNVAWRAGVGGTSGDACDLYAWYCSSADMHKIKPGTIIAVSKHSHTVAGNIWGHVGVYVGDGKVRDSVHGRTRTSKLSWWVSHYGTTVKPKWGWYGNRKLS